MNFHAKSQVCTSKMAELWKLCTSILKGKLSQNEMGIRMEYFDLLSKSTLSQVVIHLGLETADY